jgi:hypothetical protein
MLKWLLGKMLGSGTLVGVQVLRVSPGDVVVLSYPSPLSRETATRLKDVFEGIMPSGVKVVALDAGLSVKTVVRGDPEGLQRFIRDELIPEVARALTRGDVRLRRAGVYRPDDEGPRRNA